jgi:exonuclease SbcD
MRILHTADWHLGDRLGRIDRTQDIRRSVEAVARYCGEHQVDVLLVAGDLFSEMARPDSLRGSIEHLQEVFEPFLLDGGTILAVTGNHDNENFCRTLQLVMTLAAPTAGKAGDLRPCGRLYLATSPSFLRLKDRKGQEVQFILMPYPTPARYLEQEQVQRYGSLEEKNQHLREAYSEKLRQVLSHPAFRPELQTVLAAHVHVEGVRLPSLFRLSEEESIVFAEADLPAHLAYVALGHIHQPQCVLGLPHVRYSGSIERLDLGERADQKGVVVLDIGLGGLEGEPRVLPLDATPIYAVELHSPLRDELARLREQFPDAQQDLVQIEFQYAAGVDNLEETLRQFEDIFPRWYSRHWTEASALGAPLTLDAGQRGKSFEDSVRDYLKEELANHSEEERDAVLNRAKALLREIES